MRKWEVRRKKRSMVWMLPWVVICPHSYACSFDTWSKAIRWADSGKCLHG